MSASKLISTKQCKRARALLKWNLLDLASRTRIPVKHLEKFERNQVRLTKPENDDVVKIFTRYKIEFTGDGDAILKGGGHESDYHNTDQDFKHYDLNKSQVDAVEDLAAKQAEAERKAKEEEEKRLRREREEAEKRKKQGQ